MPSRPRSRGRGVQAARATGKFAQSIALLVSFVLVAGIGGVLAAGLALPGVALANGAASLSQKAFDDLPSELNLTELPQKSQILDAEGNLLATFFTENRSIVTLDQIAPIMQKAVIAVEDKRFYEHAGIDPQGMIRAFAVGVFNDETQGASTLTQQYVKNVLLQAANNIEDPVERQAALREATINKGTEGYARKLREAKLAITLEKRMTKDQILEAYLNIAQFGAKSIYGVEAAAQSFFSKHASELNYIEAATIAGITQSPTANDPQRNPAQSQGRRNVVLGLMRDQGYITPQEYAAGVATPLPSTLHPSVIKQGCTTAGDVVAGSGFFCDYVTKIIRNDPAFGADENERMGLLYRGGLTITTTLMPAEQTIAWNEVNAGVPLDDPSGVGSTIVTVEPGTGKITAMAQNRIYSAAQSDDPTVTSVNWNTPNQYGSASGFAPGSTFKPFTLVEWLKAGHSLTETFDGTLRPLPYADFTACGSPYGRGTYKFGNSEGQGGVMDALKATKDSVNSAYLAMATQLDLCNIMQGAADLGVVKPGGAAGTGNVDPKPANVIGSDSVAPLSMAAAFAAFAANGTYCKPIAITQVVDADGNQLPVPTADCQEKLEPRIAAAVNYTLKNVWSGTAKSVKPKPTYPAAGKTGTTTENENNWFVGYTPLRATAVWVGHPEGFYTMHRQTINGHYYGSGPYGSSIAAPTWTRYMNQVMAGIDVPDFAAPGNKEVYGNRVDVPDVIGMSPEAATQALEAAGFQVKIAKNLTHYYLPAGTVATQSATGKATENSVITLTLSDGAGKWPRQENTDGGGHNGGGGNGPGGDNTGPGDVNPPGFGH